MAAAAAAPEGEGAAGGGRTELLVADGSIEVVWGPAPAAGFRRPSPGTAVTVHIARLAPHPDPVECALTAAVGERDFVDGVTKAFGSNACHPIELAVLRMRRGEELIAQVGTDCPGGTCQYHIKMVKVVSPVPLEQLGAATLKRLAGVQLELAERYRGEAAWTWAGQQYARAVQALLLSTLLLAGEQADDAQELANMLAAAYVGVAACHVDHAPDTASPKSTLHKAAEAADRALEVAPESADVAGVVTRVREGLRSSG